MRRTLFLITLLLVSPLSVASDWTSPTDARYRDQDPDLFEKVVQARQILDTWRGQTNKLRASVRLLNAVLETNDAFAPAYREYARAVIMAGVINSDKFREGSLEQAERLIELALELEPEYADAYVLLGHVYTEMGHYFDATQALETAERIGTRNPWLQLNWGTLLLAEQKTEDALRRFRRVAEAKPDNRKVYASALSGITSSYKRMGEYEKARDAYEKQIAFEPESAWQWGNFASFLLFTYGDVDLAIEKARMALQLMDYGMGRFVLASALYTKWAMIRDDPDNDNDAERYFEEAWSLYPYPKRVIREAARHPRTLVTARYLSQWIQENEESTTEKEQVEPAF